MKRILLFSMLCAVFGIGALFMFRRGEQEREQEREAQEQKAELIGLEDITIQEGGSLPGSVSEVRGTKAVREVRVDTSKVNVRKPGRYPIAYHYTDASGKAYQEEIICTVEGRPREPEGSSGQGKGAVQVAPVQTGDENRIMLLSGIAGASFAVICLMAARREKKI